MSILKSTGQFRGDEIIDQQREHLEPHEVTALFAELKKDPFWYAYFRLQYYFGCRISEVALVMREDVEWNGRPARIVIRRLKKAQFQRVDAEGKPLSRKEAKARGHTEKRKVSDGYTPDVLQLPPKLLGLLAKVRDAGNPDNPWLFQSARRAGRAVPRERMKAIRILEGGWRAIGRSVADVRFREAARAAGIPRRLTHSHVLRHTRATLLLADDWRPEDVQRLLGHSDLKTTYRYLGVAKALRLRLGTQAQLGDVED